jgi:hypothetical protein
VRVVINLSKGDVQEHVFVGYNLGNYMQFQKNDGGIIRTSIKAVMQNLDKF